MSFHYSHILESKFFFLAHAQTTWSIFNPLSSRPHQWQSGSALKNGRQEVTGSIPSHTFRPSRSEFPLVFFETRINAGYFPLERPCGGHSPYRPRSHKWNLALILEPTSVQQYVSLIQPLILLPLAFELKISTVFIIFATEFSLV